MYYKKLINPEYFQGNNKKKRYFEGWYFKLVSQDEIYTIAFIPGISLATLDQHAFIQVFISKQEETDVSLKTYYIRYQLKDFTFGHDSFWIMIGENYFSNERIKIKLQNNQIDLSGEIEFDHLTPLKRTLFMPNIMGFFGYFNFMECYHGVVSMTHHLTGTIHVNHQLITFDTGKGYIEKDWGKSFPKSYVWMQSNHFENQETSFLFSYADIPFLGLHFKGLIINLLYNQKEYRFATYNHAKVIKEEFNENSVHYQIKKGIYLLDIEGKSTKQIGLASPKNGMMIEQIKEGLSGYIHLKLYLNNSLIYEDSGRHAGIEIMKL